MEPTSTTIEQAEPPKSLNRLGNWMTGTVSKLNPTLGGSPKETNEPTAPGPIGTDNAGDGPAVGTDTASATDEKETTVKSAGTETSPAELPEDKWPRSAQEWKKFKEVRSKQLTERETKIKALETELSEVRAKINQPSVDPKEIEALKKERDELSNELKVAKVERHPRFKAYFEGKTNAQIDLAKKIVGPDMANKVEEVLKLPEGTYRNNQIEEVMVGLGPIQQSRFGGILNALSEIESERNREIQNASASYDSLQKSQQEQMQAAQANFQKTVADTLQSVQDAKNGLPQWQKRDGDAEWNAGLEERLKSAKNLLSGTVTDPKVVIQAALDAVALPAVLKDNLGLREHIKKLEAQVQKLSAANPSPVGERTQTATETTQMPPVKPGSRPMEITSGWVKSLQAARNQQ